MTPMERVLAADVAENAATVATRMAVAAFDYAPVTRAGFLCGYVRQDVLAAGARTVGDVHEPLTAVALVAGDTPLATLLPALCRMAFQFVVEGESIGGIVTPSDLNKQAGRSYFYLLLAELEMEMAERVRAGFPDQEDVLTVLPAGRADGIRKRMGEERRDDVLPDVISALDLTDLLNLVKRSDVLAAALGSRSASAFDREVLRPITDLRHRVMHTVRTMASDAPASLAALMTVENRIRELMAALA
jgi:hypothetical protein